MSEAKTCIIGLVIIAAIILIKEVVIRSQDKKYNKGKKRR